MINPSSAINSWESPLHAETTGILYLHTVGYECNGIIQLMYYRITPNIFVKSKYTLTNPSFYEHSWQIYRPNHTGSNTNPHFIVIHSIKDFGNHSIVHCTGRLIVSVEHDTHLQQATHPKNHFSPITNCKMVFLIVALILSLNGYVL